VKAVRPAFLAAAEAAQAVLALPHVRERWREPSALAEMSVGALAAHLVRAVTNVDRSLEAPPPAADQEGPLSGAAYFSPVTADLATEINSRVRTTSEDEALLGPAAVAGQLTRALDRLRTRLPGEPEDRLLRARGGELLRLDEYLRTRLIELSTHIDDLCVSLRHPTPEIPGIDIAIDTLVAVAVHRHGSLAVLRGLARRERDRVEALRVL
jgi:hypothetical protein